MSGIIAAQRFKVRNAELFGVEGFSEARGGNQPRCYALGYTATGLWVAASRGVFPADRAPGILGHFVIHVGDEGAPSGQREYVIHAGGQQVRHGSLKDPRTSKPTPTIVSFEYGGLDAFLRLSPYDAAEPAGITYFTGSEYASVMYRETVGIDLSLLDPAAMPPSAEGALPAA